MAGLFLCRTKGYGMVPIKFFFGHLMGGRCSWMVIKGGWLDFFVLWQDDHKG